MRADLIGAILVGVVALLLLSYVIFTLWRSFRGAAPKKFSLSRIRDRWYLNKKIRALSLLDSLLEQEPSPSLLSTFFSALRSGLCIERFVFDEELIQEISRHHDALVSRLITISERFHTHLESLAILEGLFEARTELLIEYRGALEIRDDVLRKQREKGRSPQEWATNEFSRKLTLLDEKCLTNKRSIESTLRDMLSTLQNVRADSGVTYH